MQNQPDTEAFGKALRESVAEANRGVFGEVESLTLACPSRGSVVDSR